MLPIGRFIMRYSDRRREISWDSTCYTHLISLMLSHCIHRDQGWIMQRNSWYLFHPVVFTSARSGISRERCCMNRTLKSFPLKINRLSRSKSSEMWREKQWLFYMNEITKLWLRFRNMSVKGLVVSVMNCEKQSVNLLSRCLFSIHSFVTLTFMERWLAECSSARRSYLTAKSRREPTGWHFIFTWAKGRVFTLHLRIWWTKTARTQKQTLISSLNVTFSPPWQKCEPGMTEASCLHLEHQRMTRCWAVVGESLSPPAPLRHSHRCCPTCSFLVIAVSWSQMSLSSWKSVWSRKSKTSKQMNNIESIRPFHSHLDYQVNVPRVDLLYPCIVAVSASGEVGGVWKPLLMNARCASWWRIN